MVYLFFKVYLELVRKSLCTTVNQKKKLFFSPTMVPDTDVLFNMIPMQAKPVYSLKEKIKRTTQLLKELKVLSQDCQELEKNQEKDQQLFSRRTLQVGAEIQDARDLLSSICQNRLPLRQWQFLFDSKKEVR